jgi:hypothetical protein
MKIFYRVHVRFFFFFLRVFLLLKAYMYVEFPTMNFNFTLHFLESYFQFNRKYLFEVILHFPQLYFLSFFAQKKNVACSLPRCGFVYSAESFFMYSTQISSNCLHLYELKREEKSETFRRYVEEQVNIRI